MPTYDFRCGQCSARREVRASYEDATSVRLVCLACGGTMEKAFSASIHVLTGSGQAPPSSSAARRPRRRRGGDSCDAAIRLSRPNPFRGDIRKAAGEGDA